MPPFFNTFFSKKKKTPRHPNEDDDVKDRDRRATDIPRRKSPRDLGLEGYADDEVPHYAPPSGNHVSNQRAAHTIADFRQDHTSTPASSSTGVVFPPFSGIGNTTETDTSLDTPQKRGSKNPPSSDLSFDRIRSLFLNVTSSSSRLNQSSSAVAGEDSSVGANANVDRGRGGEGAVDSGDKRVRKELPERTGSSGEARSTMVEPAHSNQRFGNEERSYGVNNDRSNRPPSAPPYSGSPDSNVDYLDRQQREDDDLQLALALSLSQEHPLQESSQAPAPADNSSHTRRSSDGSRGQRKSMTKQPKSQQKMTASKINASRHEPSIHPSSSSASRIPHKPLPKEQPRRTSKLDFRELTEEEAVERIKAIDKTCGELGVPFVDDSFTPGNKILYENGRTRRQDADSLCVVQHFGGGQQSLVWRRSSQILQRPGDLQIEFNNPMDMIGCMRAFSKCVEWRIIQPGGVFPEDISQGALGNCWFCGVLAAVAANSPDLISKLFLFPNDGKLSPTGAYLIKLFDGGRWVYIPIDDYFPCFSNKAGSFLSFSGARRNQLFVPLLEKAYSKLKTNYEAVEGGCPSDALRLFTGWPSVVQELRPADPIKEEDTGNFALQARCPFIDVDLLWARLTSATSAGLILVGSCGFQQENQQYKAVGLSPSHCYGIEKAHTTTCGLRLLRIRNPWGTGLKWSGPFSDDSPLWNARVRREVSYQKMEGVFWMPLEELIRYFMSVSFSLYRPNWVTYRDMLALGGDTAYQQKNGEQLTTSTAMVLNSSGGACWDLDVFSTTEAFISLIQMEEKFNVWMTDIMLVVFKKGGRPPLHNDTSGSEALTFVACSNRGTTANELVDIFLQPGSYVIVALSFLSPPLGFGPLMSDMSINMYLSHTGFEVRRREGRQHQHGGLHPRTRQQAVAHFARHSGKEKSLFGGNLLVYTSHQAGLILYAENHSPSRWFRLDLIFSDVFNMEFSRPMAPHGVGEYEEFRSRDSIPPGHGMVIMVATGRAGGYRDSYTSKFSQSLPLLSSEIHEPPLCAFHTPFLL